jgi:hypothetical protein
LIGLIKNLKIQRNAIKEKYEAASGTGPAPELGTTVVKPSTRTNISKKMNRF